MDSTKAMDNRPLPVHSNLSAPESAVAGNTQFALDLYRQLAGTPGNLFFSPYSISTALAMTYAGARGETAAQMARTLHFPGEQAETHRGFASLRARMEEIRSRGAVQLQIANRLWPHPDYPFLQPFLDICQAEYGAAIVPVDYAQPEVARQTINRWVADETEEKIRELIPSGVLNALTRLALVNAVYFKGNWASQFDSAKTEVAPFWIVPDESVDAPLMNQKATLRYGESGALQIVELPFAGDDLALLLLLPKERNGLPGLEESLSLERMTGWLASLRPREVNLFLPRFRVSSNFHLNAPLMALGMTDAFDDARADLSGMDGRPQNLYIAAVFHQARMEANEEGAEAAAATAVVIKLRSLPPPPVVARADHPFLLLLRERQTGSLLFLGRVLNPVAQSD